MKISARKYIKLEKILLKILQKLKKMEKKVIGYGAPAKATTALNFYGISDQIDFIVEDNCQNIISLYLELKYQLKAKSL